MKVDSLLKQQEGRCFRDYGSPAKWPGVWIPDMDKAEKVNKSFMHQRQLSISSGANSESLKGATTQCV